MRLRASLLPDVLASRMIAFLVDALKSSRLLE